MAGDAKAGRAGETDLRERLREKGYLVNPLEKFLVGKVDSESSILRTNLTVGARVGFLSGLLLGLLVSLALLLLVPDLSRRPQDAMFVVLLFTLLFAVSVGLIGVLSGILTSIVYRITRRVWPATRLTAFKVGAVAGALFFLYFTLLWSQYDQRYPLGASLLAFCVVLGVSVFVGRTIAVGAFVVLCRLEGAPEAGGLPARRRAFRALILLSLGALVAFFGGLAFSRMRAGSAAQSPPLVTSVPVDTRVVLVTVDGLSRAMAEEMMRSGDLPAISALVSSGPALRFEPVNPAVPPSMWTTVATGRPPDEHGITTFTYPRVVGTEVPLSVPPDTVGLGEVLNVVMPWLQLARKSPVSGRFNPERSLWDVFSLKDVRVGVVNWWLTWPASDVSGFVASDRTYFRLVESGFDAGGAPKGNLELSLATYPPELLLECLEAARHPDTIDPESVAFCGEPTDPRTARREEALRWSIGVDSWAAEFAAEKLAVAASLENPYGFFAVSLYGLDALRNALAELRAEEKGGEPFESQAIAVGMVSAYARHVDRLVSEIRDAAGADRDVVFVLATSPGKSGEGESADGILAFSGPALASSPPPLFERSARAVDVAPTLLYLMGFPTSREMPGRILEEILPKGAFDARAPDVIATYGRRAKGAFDGVENESDLDRLRQLGYVK